MRTTSLVCTGKETSDNEEAHCCLQPASDLHGCRGMLNARLIEARQAEARWTRELAVARCALHETAQAQATRQLHERVATAESQRSQKHVAQFESAVVHWSSTAAALDAAITAVASDELLSPVRIMGIAATWAVVRTIALSGGSAVWAMVQLLQNRL